MTTVKLTANGVGRGKVYINGVEMPGIKSVETKVRAINATQVSLELSVPSIESLELTGATIAIKGVAMPPSVEAALFVFLCEKNGLRGIDVTDIASTDAEYAPIV